MEILAFIIGFIIIIIGLAISIALHEIGHLYPAKKFGIKVTKYMVGFGPTIWKKNKGETEYGIKVFPFGGYISMLGMYPPKNNKSDSLNIKKRNNLYSKMVQQAQSHSDALIGDEKPNRLFYAQSVPKKLLVMFGGPFMNLILAFVFYTILLVGIGIPQPGTTVSYVSDCVINSEETDQSCKSGDELAPGKAAGIEKNDEIIALDGKKVDSWQEIQKKITSSAGKVIEFSVLRKGKKVSLNVKPVEVERFVLNDNNEIQKDSSGEAIKQTQGAVGLYPKFENTRQNIIEVPRYVWKNIVSVFSLILQLPQKLLGVWDAAFGEGQRDPNGPVSIVGAGRFAGEVAASDDIPILSKIQTNIGMIAALNVALFAFNMIPLLPLDGGHIAGALFEGFRRRIAFWRNKPDPGPVNMAKLAPLSFIMFVIFFAMGALLIFADIVKPISIL